MIKRKRIIISTWKVIDHYSYLERFNAQQKKYSKALASVDSLNHLQDKDFAKIFV
jgi:hypothetical protein